MYKLFTRSKTIYDHVPIHDPYLIVILFLELNERERYWNIFRKIAAKIYRFIYL